jgi:hypothetical protein
MMMRQGPNNNNNKNRGRGRGNPQHGGGGNNNGGNRRPQGPNRNQSFDSNGPDVRIRGSAYQVFEKYLNLARDATAAGDRIMAESYYQHAEHYHRVINVMEYGEDGQRRPRQDGYNNQGQQQYGDQGGEQQGEDAFGNEGQQFAPEPVVVTGHGPQPYQSAVPPEQQEQPVIREREDLNAGNNEQQFDRAEQPE